VYDLIPAALAHTSLGAFGRLDKDTTGLLLLGSDGGLQSLLTHPSTSLPKRYEVIIKAGRTADDKEHDDRLGVVEPHGPSTSVEWRVPCGDGCGDVVFCAPSVLAGGAAAAFTAGVVLPDGTRCLPAELEVLGTGFALRGAPAGSSSDGEDQIFWGPLPPPVAYWLCEQSNSVVNSSGSPPAAGKPAVFPASPVLRVALTLHEGIFHQVKRMLGTVGAHVVQLHRASVGPITLGDLPRGGVREVRDEEVVALAALLPADEASRSNASRGAISERGGSGGPRGRQQRKAKRGRTGGVADAAHLAEVAAKKRARGLLEGQAKRAQRAEAAQAKAKKAQAVQAD
jgi:hypothetical protein